MWSGIMKFDLPGAEVWIWLQIVEFHAQNFIQKSIIEYPSSCDITTNIWFIGAEFTFFFVLVLMIIVILFYHTSSQKWYKWCNLPLNTKKRAVS